MSFSVSWVQDDNIFNYRHSLSFSLGDVQLWFSNCASRLTSVHLPASQGHDLSSPWRLFRNRRTRPRNSRTHGFSLFFLTKKDSGSRKNDPIRPLPLESIRTLILTSKERRNNTFPVRTSVNRHSPFTVTVISVIVYMGKHYCFFRFIDPFKTSIEVERRRRVGLY